MHTTSQNSINSRAHALVIGGSLAGLFAARVLSDHFERVTILERDDVHDRPESRKGQPQTRHLHGLLAQGLHIIKAFFPGIEQEMVEGGAITGDMGRDMRWYQFDGYKTQFESGLVGLMMSRPFLEWYIRRRVMSLPNVTLRPSCAVHEVITTADRKRITGVQITNREQGSGTETLRTDLVIDAGGRGSVTPKWLASLGYEKPPQEEIKIRVGYASRLYRRRPGELVGAKMVMISPTPPAGKRGTFIMPVENDRWIITAGGWAGDYPPADEAGFLAFVRSLPTSDIYDILRRAEPLSDIVTYRFPSNLRRHYEKLKRFPEGYLVMGDAVASFNPIYGQGMTSAAMQARVLEKVLHQHRILTGLWKPYFQQVAKVVNMPWQMAAGEDFRYPETEGKKPAFTDLINAYVAKVHLATHYDPVVYAHFLQVMNLLAPPTSLMHPRIAWRIMFRQMGVAKEVPELETHGSY